jgi:hypothetical protein
MTLRQLAEEVGVAGRRHLPLLPSKGQLLVDLQVEHLEFLLSHWAAEQPANDDPLLRLRAFVDFHIRFHTLRRREAFVANMELRSVAPADYRPWSRCAAGTRISSPASCAMAWRRGRSRCPTHAWPPSGSSRC